MVEGQDKIRTEILAILRLSKLPMTCREIAEQMRFRGWRSDLHRLVCRVSSHITFLRSLHLVDNRTMRSETKGINLRVCGQWRWYPAKISVWFLRDTPLNSVWKNLRERAWHGHNKQPNQRRRRPVTDDMRQMIEDIRKNAA